MSEPTVFYASTITIWTDFDPTLLELSHLAREAEVGGAICTDFEVSGTTNKGYVPEDALSFFGEEE